MKNQKRAAFAILSVMGLLIVGVVGILAFSAILGAGVVYATTAGVVPDVTVTTEKAREVSENLLRPDISKKITKIMPSAAPLDTLIREAGAHEKTGSIDFKFYSSQLRSFQDKLQSQFTRPASLPADGVYTLAVANIRMWQVDDGLQFHGVNGEDGGPLVAHVVAKSGSNLSVIFLNGANSTGQQTGSVPPSTIAAETAVGRLGASKAELDAQTDPYGHLPTDEENYCQQHMAQIEESFWQKWTNKEVDWDIRDMQTLSIFDLRCQMEGTSWFGVKRKMYDPIKDNFKYHSGGVVRYLDVKIPIAATGDINDKTVASWAKRIFVGNAGADRRYMFIGSGLNERLSAVPMVQKQIDGKSTETVYGLTFNKIETNFGVLMLRHHQLFNYHGFTNNAVGLDLNNIRKRVFDPMKIRKLDLMSSGIKKANAYVLEENFGLEIRYRDTHALLYTSASGS
jgi:hypothetical protein